MITNNAALSKAPSASHRSRTGRIQMDQAFYDRVRSNFIQQSASYLRSGSARRPSWRDGAMRLRS